MNGRETTRGRLFQAAVIIAGLLLWSAAAAGVLYGYTWHDREVLLALLPLVILVGLLPIKFPLPSR